MIAALPGNARRNAPAFVEIRARNDKFGAKGGHSRILLNRIALGRDDDGRDAMVSGRGGDGLSVIAACRRHRAFG